LIEIFRVTERPRDFQKVQIAIGEATDKTVVSGINSSFDMCHHGLRCEADAMRIQIFGALFI
jgi:hypothetical protein